jgi:hypothetical protein
MSSLLVIFVWGGKVIHCLHILYFGKGGRGEEVREKVQ